MIGFDQQKRLDLVKKFGVNSFSTLLLYDDISVFPLSVTDGFVGYQNARKMLIVFGEPICDPKDYRIATAEFIDFCKKNGKQFIFICCGQAFLDAVKDLDFSSIRIGEDFIFDASTYAPKGDKTKMVRLARNHSLRAGAIVKEYDCRGCPNPRIEESFKTIALRWLKKNNRFKAHIMGLNLFEYRELKRYFYAEVNGRPIAFITCVPIFGRDGILIEDAIRDPDAPYGIIELITLHIIATVKESNGRIVTFGVSPKLDVSELSGPSRVVANIGVWFANKLFNLYKLYHFRKKFHTQISEPSYLLKYPKGLGLLDLARILTSF